MKATDIIRKDWDDGSDAYFQRTYGSGDLLDILTETPERAFPEAMRPVIHSALPDLRGKRVCVPSSGDNVAAFGLHLLGARVTSVDLSARQIANAKAIAVARGWDIEFICDNSMELGKIGDGAFDLVYTSNGVHVWISNLTAMYRNFSRILKPGGHYIFFETHPAIRPFDDRTYDIKIKKDYEEIGPFGEVPTYGWRTQDFINAIISSGFAIREMREFHSTRSDLRSHNYLYVDDNNKFNWPGDTYDWRNNPWAALPQGLGLCAQKAE